MILVTQVALTLVLLVKLISFETRMEALTEQPKYRAIHDEPLSSDVPDAVQVSTDSGVSEEQLRQIVREEMRRATKVMGGDHEPKAELAQNESLFDEAEMQYQQDLIVDELEFLKQQQDVSSAELENLMGDIVKLDPERRTELLAMLNRAMNRGEIKGRL